MYDNVKLKRRVKQIQQCLNKIQKWALENGFKFSKTKTQCMHFCQLRGLHNDPVLKLDGVEIPVVDQYKFLGIIFDRKLSFIPHINYLKAKCLMRDLSDFGFKGRLPIFIDNFLSNKNFKVRVGTTLSGLQGQDEGVPQGSILSVTLFSIKINNIVKALNPGVDCSLYVDDFLICYRSKHIHTIERQLQQCLNKIQKWALENGSKFSKTKTQCMHFCQLRGLHNDRSLSWMVWRSLWLTSINF